ncbi:MAG TPA: SRPBCC family protein [Acidobacteriaceae bacterium]|nr:SRPBCC family protein [Acidobacteriaceae bacterium]
MQLIELETKIAAPLERCFLLSLSIELHMASTAPTRERAIAGVTHGIIGPDQTVTWRGRHFGLMLTHTSLIDRYDPPNYFRDVMVAGHFRSFEHEHFYEPIEKSQTLMRDRLWFSAPFGVAGILTEQFFLRRYFIKFLQARNAAIRRVAESPTQEWRDYLG